MHDEMPGASGLQNGVDGRGGRARVAGAGEPLRFPGGSEARTPTGGRPGGQQAPALLGAIHPRPADGLTDGWGRLLLDPCHAGAGMGWKHLCQRLAVSICRAVAGKGAAGVRPACATGGYRSPTRRGVAPAGRGTKAKGFRPSPQAAGRRERSDRRVGGSAVNPRRTSRARPSFKPIKPIYTY